MISASAVWGQGDALYTLKHKNHMSDKHDGTGVYKINCNDCNSMYVGQIGILFRLRYFHFKQLNEDAILIQLFNIYYLLVGRRVS